MQNQGDFKLWASSTDVVKRFAVIKGVVIKRVIIDQNFQIFNY